MKYKEIIEDWKKVINEEGFGKMNFEECMIHSKPNQFQEVCGTCDPKKQILPRWKSIAYVMQASLSYLKGEEQKAKDLMYKSIEVILSAEDNPMEIACASNYARMLNDKKLQIKCLFKAYKLALSRNRYDSLWGALHLACFFDNEKLREKLITHTLKKQFKNGIEEKNSVEAATAAKRLGNKESNSLYQKALLGLYNEMDKYESTRDFAGAINYCWHISNLAREFSDEQTIKKMKLKTIRLLLRRKYATDVEQAADIYNFDLNKFERALIIYSAAVKKYNKEGSLDRLIREDTSIFDKASEVALKIGDKELSEIIRKKKIELEASLVKEDITDLNNIDELLDFWKTK